MEPTTDRDLGRLDLTRALEHVTVPAYVVGRDGRIVWMNRGAIDVVGDRVGDAFARVVAPEDLNVARNQFAKKLIGEAALTEYEVTIVTSERCRLRVHTSSVPLWQEGEIVGVFGIAYPAAERDELESTGSESPPPPELTARQYEVLALLADGLGTTAIAARLGVAEETARNHIRAVFAQLDVHSRLEAVVRAYQLGLLDPRKD